MGLLEIKTKETDFVKTTIYEGYGYEVRFYQTKESDLKDKISVKPLDPGRPEIIVMGKEFSLSFAGTYLLEEIPQINQYLIDAEMSVTEIKALISKKNMKL